MVERRAATAPSRSSARHAAEADSPGHPAPLLPVVADLAMADASPAARKLTAKGQRTRAAILDAAERQFAERGFDGVSLRQIIEEARVQMGQVQYYFPTKDDVFAQVLDRRLDAVVADYRDAVAWLDRMEAAGRMDLRAVIHAVCSVSRAWLASDDIGRHRYLRMLGLATMSYDQPQYVRRHGTEFRPLNERIVAAMTRLYPRANPRNVLTAYYHLEANLISVYGNIDAHFRRTGQTRDAGGIHAFYDGLENFLVGGCEALILET